ncbi:MAG: serine hydrolase [Saprospiraceae bacterium]|nr:serine hydrolase [Saprospiraceae bacterium]
MNKILITIICGYFSLNTFSQSLYFPPVDGSSWDTMSYSRLGWCSDKIDKLYDLLESNNSKGFILLKDGKIVLEKYFGDHNEKKVWYWASAGKTLTAFMVGLAQEDGFLKLIDPSSKYMGKGWTSCTPEQEEKITVLNQLCMTSGLDDGLGDAYCTLDSCLKYKADAGTRWAYHNAPYTLLDSVLKNATKTQLNTYISQKLSRSTGITGLFLKQDFNNVFYSTGRTMARFGLLCLNQGNWNGTQIMKDQDYFFKMTHTSQNINLSYGYLWWLNDAESYRLPGSQFTFRGHLIPNAPYDIYAAMGKNGQFINVAPSKNMVWIRFGDAPDNSPVPFGLNDTIWRMINNLPCIASGINSNSLPEIKIFQSQKDIFHIQSPITIQKYEVFDSFGNVVQEKAIQEERFQIQLNIPAGLYFIQCNFDNDSNKVYKIVVH